MLVVMMIDDDGDGHGRLDDGNDVRGGEVFRWWWPKIHVDVSHDDGDDHDERMIVVMVMNNPTSMMMMVGSVRYVILSLKPGNRREAEVKIQRSQIWFLIDRSRVDEEDKFERDVIMMMMMMMSRRRRRIRMLLGKLSKTF